MVSTLAADAAAVSVEIGENVVPGEAASEISRRVTKRRSAMDVMMQRRIYSAPLREVSGASLMKDDRSTNTAHRPKNKGGSLHPVSCRLALLRALDRYDSDTHGEAISSWCGQAGGHTTENGSRVGKVVSQSEAIAANTARPLLNYVSTPSETLSMVDVPKLLAEYKMLAKICSVLVSEQSPNRIGSHS